MLNYRELANKQATPQDLLRRLINRYRITSDDLKTIKTLTTFSDDGREALNNLKLEPSDEKQLIKLIDQVL